MINQFAIQSDSFGSYYPSLGDYREQLTGFLITCLVLGVLATTYVTCGYSQLPQISPFFAPLSTLNSLQLNVIISSWATVSLASASVLLFIHLALRVPIEFKVRRALQQLEQLEAKLEDQKEHLQEIRALLSKGYASYLDYYGFYYRLSRVSKSVKEDPKSSEEWNAFLQQIDGSPIYRENGETSALIDCSVELDRLAEKATELCVETLTKNTLNYEHDLMAMGQICKEAFDTWEYHDIESLKRYFFCKYDTVYVVRNEQTREVLGLIVLREVTTNEGKKALFIHSLARKASAVDLGMTEKFKEHFVKNIDKNAYAAVRCQVRADNKPAQYIYQKIGFKFTDQSGPIWSMVYDPEPDA